MAVIISGASSQVSEPSCLCMIKSMCRQFNFSNADKAKTYATEQNENCIFQTTTWLADILILWDSSLRDAEHFSEILNTFSSLLPAHPGVLQDQAQSEEYGRGVMCLCGEPVLSMRKTGEL